MIRLGVTGLKKTKYVYLLELIGGKARSGDVIY